MTNTQTPSSSQVKKNVKEYWEGDRNIYYPSLFNTVLEALEKYEGNRRKLKRYKQE